MFNSLAGQRTLRVEKWKLFDHRPDLSCSRSF